MIDEPLQEESLDEDIPETPDDPRIEDVETQIAAHRENVRVAREAREAQKAARKSTPQAEE